MKHHTNSEQTAKLIELGLPRPRCLHDGVLAYNIGELIEWLPGRINGIDLTIERYYAFEQWHIYYDASQYFTKQTELIYALYDMIVKLKEEEVI